MLLNHLVRMDSKSRYAWLDYLWRYLILLACGNLIWEFVHMPFYAVWNGATAGEIVIYALHCVGGDLLIGTSSLFLAAILVALPSSPKQRYWMTAFSTVIFGVVYTVWSERYNVYVLESWSYSESMPIIPGLKIGVTPTLQWLMIPFGCFWILRRSASRANQLT